MKALVLIMMLVSASAQAAVFTCVGTKYRSGNVIPVDAKFTFSINGINGASVITDFKGSVKVAQSSEEYPFSISTPVVSDAKYNPHKYLNSIRFSNINSHGSVEWPTEYGMTGELIIERGTNSKGHVSAHYIFQEDQSGGTIDLACSVNDF